jgi:hypothetical protein
VTRSTLASAPSSRSWCEPPGSVVTVLRRVDTVELEAVVVDEYCRIVEDEMTPLVEEAGATLEGYWRTTEGLGEPVWVQTVWSCPDFESWNVIRRNLVLDPRWYACAERLHGMTRSGTRRFYLAADTALVR